MTITLYWRRVRETGGIVAPRRGDAGYDILAAEHVVLPALGRAVVPTGVALQLPDGYMARVSSRSGFAFGKGKYPVRNRRISIEHAHSVIAFHGTIDASYRGEVKVLLFNLSRNVVTIPVNARIAQLVIIKVETPSLVEVSTLEASERGEQGFGSSGVS